MREFERQFAETVIENLSTSIANSVREANDIESLVDGDNELSAIGRMYVLGYLTGRLTMVRAGAIGNPNLSVDDLETLADIVDDHESGIAAALYA